LSPSEFLAAVNVLIRKKNISAFLDPGSKRDADAPLPRAHEVIQLTCEKCCTA
jgi:hypothetical protein